MDPDRPRTLSSPEVLGVRLAELDAPHVAGLNAWVRVEGHKRSVSMPWFDPGDAGRNARVLFLLESPGPMADADKGSGVVSIDNNDPTAKNLWTFRHEAALLEGVVHWNAVPWWLGRPDQAVVAPTDADRRRAVGLLRSLLPLLPELQVVVPMGNHAKQTWGQLLVARPNNLPVLPTWHPSGLGLAGAGKREAVQATVLAAAGLAGITPPTPPEPLAPRLAEADRRAPVEAARRLADLGRRGRERITSVRRGSRS